MICRDFALLSKLFFQHLYKRMFLKLLIIVDETKRFLSPLRHKKDHKLSSFFLTSKIHFLCFMKKNTNLQVKKRAIFVKFEPAYTCKIKACSISAYYGDKKFWGGRDLKSRHKKLRSKKKSTVSLIFSNIWQQLTF